MSFADRVDIFLEDDSPADVIVRRVYERLIKGNSKIKKPLSSAEINMVDIIKAIKSQRCLTTAEYDLGSNYMDQVVAGAVREEFPLEQQNLAREVMGLKPLTKRQLAKKKARDHAKKTAKISKKAE